MERTDTATWSPPRSLVAQHTQTHLANALLPSGAQHSILPCWPFRERLWGVTGPELGFAACGRRSNPSVLYRMFFSK